MATFQRRRASACMLYVKRRTPCSGGRLDVNGRILIWRFRSREITALKSLKKPRIQKPPTPYELCSPVVYFTGSLKEKKNRKERDIKEKEP